MTWTYDPKPDPKEILKVVLTDIDANIFMFAVWPPHASSVLKLGTEIPIKNDITSPQRFENSWFGSTIACEEGLAPSRRSFENGTN